MNREVAWLTMLAAKIPSMNDGGGGIPNITPEMVAGALAYGRLRRESYIVGRIKYLAEDEYRKELYDIMEKKVLSWSANQGWLKNQKHKPGLYTRMIELAIGEVVTPMPCLGCGGSGYRRVNDALHECKKCLGSGAGNFSHALIARALQLDRSKEYYKVWRPHYEEIRSHIQVYDGELLAHLKKQLGGS